MWLCSSYGIWCFGLRLYGDALEQSIYIHLNLMHYINYPASNIGLFISLWLLVFYVTVLVLLAKVTVWILEESSRIQSSPEFLLLRKGTSTSNWNRSAKLMLDFNKSPAPYLEFAFEGISRLPRKKLEVCLPMVSQIRNYIIPVILVYMTNLPIAQILIGILIEVGYLIFFIKSNIRASKIEFWAETGTQGLTIVYLILRLITVMDINDNTRQSVIGFTMLILLIVICAVRLTMYVVILIIMLVKKIRKCRSGRVPQSGEIQDEAAPIIAPTNKLRASRSARLTKINKANSRRNAHV